MVISGSTIVIAWICAFPLTRARNLYDKRIVGTCTRIAGCLSFLVTYDTLDNESPRQSWMDILSMASVSPWINLSACSLTSRSSDFKDRGIKPRIMSSTSIVTHKMAIGWRRIEIKIAFFLKM